jgi:hypothetical protein
VKTPDKGKRHGQKAGVKKSTSPRDARDTRDTRRGAKPALYPYLKPFDFAGGGLHMPTLPGADGRALYLSPGGDLEGQIEALLARGGKFGALLRVFGLCGQILSGLHALAARGNKAAAGFLAEGLGEAVGNFEKLAGTKPELFLEWARGKKAIPGMISRNAEKCAGNQRLLVRLKQGEAHALANLPKGKRTWQFQDPANALAARLVEYIEDSADDYRLPATQQLHAGFELPDWLHEAMGLEAFSAKTWPTWAEVGWAILEGGNHEGLHNPKTRISNPSGRQGNPSAALTRADNRKALFEAFETIATGEHPRTARRRTKPGMSRKT